MANYHMAFPDRVFIAVSRRYATLLLFLVCCGVAIIGAFVIRDLRAAYAEAEEMYSGSVHGLERIGELQYDAQETRRTTFYALTTNDSNLQVEYADQSRDADRRVRDGIAEYAHNARSPQEIALANRLNQDWSAYLAIRDEVLASILEGSTGEAVSRDLAGGVPAFESVRQDLNEVKRLYSEDASRRQEDLAASSRRSSYRLIGILIFTFLLSSVSVWVIQRSHTLSAMQLAKLQMEFVASVSHELRTPLSVLSSAADNIADGLVQDLPAVRRYGVILQHQSRAMSELVDQILLFASTEDREIRYMLEPLEVSSIVASIVDATRELVQSAGFVLDVQVELDLPNITGNLSGVSQCLHNLIGNAVKYGGNDRRISLSAFAAPSNNRSGMEVRISIADRGIGIDSTDLAHIFDPFYRSQHVQNAQIHGTGLGLSLAKRIAESMGGRISVVSQISVGSTFTLHLQPAKGEGIQTVLATARPSRLRAP